MSYEDGGNISIAGDGCFTGYDVKLTGGIFKQQMETGADFLKGFDVKRLAASLYVNNEREGVNPPAQVYGGWEGNGLPGHSVGHYLSACVNMYMQTGDVDFKNRVDELVDLIAGAQYEDGFVGGCKKSAMDYVFNNPTTFNAGGHNDAYLNNVWGPWYSIHKIYAGLIDAYLYMGNEKALRVAEGMAEYAYNGTNELVGVPDCNGHIDRMDYMLEGEYGGMNESFAQLYEITGKPEYLDLAKRFSHKSVMDPLSKDIDNLTGLHANTQIPKIVGAAKIYSVLPKDDPDRDYYKNVAENFWKYVVYNRSYATGGNCNAEFFTELDKEPLTTLSTETCNVYNMLKLTEYLFSLDHKTEYMDFFENALYNHILGSQNPNSGDKTYNIDLTMGGHKEYVNKWNFTCCGGTGMENPGRFYKMIYYKDRDDLFVNLFIDSEVIWEDKGIVLRQNTSFPDSESSAFVFKEARGETLSVNIRIPKWCSAAQIKVNGEAVEAFVGIDGYVKILRQWNKGDKIEITMPMSYSLYTSREGHNTIVAFKYGPVLLAGELGGMPVPSIVTESRNPSDFIKKTDGSKLRFCIDDILQPGNKSITLKPFYEFVSESHMVYWKLYTSEQYKEISETGSFDERLDGATYDVVYPNNFESETAHNLRSEGRTSSNKYNNKGWRAVDGAGWFSYDLLVRPTSENYLLSIFYGKEYSNILQRTFDILIDGALLSTYTLNRNRPDDSWEYYYVEIPNSMVGGKTKVTITYRSNSDSNTAGGVFEVRTTGSMLRPY